MNDILQSPWLAPASILGVSIALGALLRTVILKAIARIFRRTATDLDDLLLAALRPHVPVWLLLGGVALAAPTSPLSPGIVSLVHRVVTAAFMLSLTVAAGSFASALLARYGERAGAAVGGTSLSQNITRLAIFAVGALLVLSNLGIAITPLLTALGVGSLAVALALQPTLSNLFAGIQISLARPIRVGDFVRLESGVEGFVEDIGWRYTRVRELPDNVIIVPNGRVAEMVVTNYNLPGTEQAALVQVGVSYRSDLSHVERVTCDVARSVLRETEGGAAGFDPFIRFHTFGDSSIDFTVILRVRAFTDRYLVIHEFIRRLKARYDAEGIEIPFPQRVLHHGGPAAGPPA